MSTIEHVAIIMDGNGRWAKKRFRPRIWGHVRGSSIVTDIVEKADDLGIKSLTMYAFSSENWSRPQDEVSNLFKLLKKFLLKERAKILKNQIRFKVIGHIEDLPVDTKKLIIDLENETKQFKGLRLSFAFGYGGRDEIVCAVNKFIKMNPGKMISEKEIEENLFHDEVKNIDLMIRTGGDQRISNFLLWQCSYAELYFTQTLWPDFSTQEFEKIIIEVSSRERRFGNVSATQKLEDSQIQAHNNLLKIKNRDS